MWYPYMSSASILEAVFRLSVLDPANFEVFSDPRNWETFRDSVLYASFARANADLKSLPEVNMQNAHLQNLFASHIASPKALDEFLCCDAVPDTAKAIVCSTVDSPLAKHLFAAIPSEKGLSICSAQFKISLCLLLGIPLPMKSNHCDCHKKRDLTMYHALSCKTHGGIIYRHDLVKDVIAELCKAARLCHEVEPKQALSGNKLRPDILVRFGNDGYDVAFDVTIDSPVRDEHALRTTLKDEQKFLRQQARHKTQKYRESCEENSASFTPIVLSAFGGIFDESYSSGIKFLTKKIRKSSFEPPNWGAPSSKAYWLQRIAIALWTGNACQMTHFLRKEKSVAVRL